MYDLKSHRVMWSLYGFPVNEKDNECVISGRFFDEIMACNDVLISLLKEITIRWFTNEINVFFVLIGSEIEHRPRCLSISPYRGF